MPKQSKAKEGVDARGRKSPFQSIKGADEWIVRHFKEYDELDSGQQAWVKLKFKGFYTEFKTDLDKICTDGTWLKVNISVKLDLSL